MANFLDNFTVVGAVSKGATKAAESVDTDAAVNAAIGSASRAVQQGNKLFRAGLEKANKLAAQAGEAVSNVEIISPELREAASKRPSPTGIASVNVPDFSKLPDPLSMFLKSEKLINTFRSPVAQNFLNDILYVQTASGQRFNPSTGEFEDFDPRKPITEDYFTDTTIDLLKKMAREKGLDGPNQSVSFEKDEVYNYLTKQGSGVKVVQTGGASAGDIIESLSGRNPADEVKLILGAFSINTDENGEITVTDMFDYNEWYHPDTEEKWTADEFQKAVDAGELDVNELAVKSFLKYGLSYGTVRSLGFLFGSKGFEDPQYQDLLTGRKSNISLGNVSELYTSPRPKLRPTE